MGTAIADLSGTPAGEALATALALAAALLHAIFGALQKGRYDPWITRGAIDAALVVMTAPVALFVVAWPQGGQWAIIAGAVAIHFVYKCGQALAYERGAYTVVYPVVRGTGPLFAVIGAYAIFGEVFSPGQWLGVAVLLAGIFGLAAYNLRTVTLDRDTLVPALALAVFTGLMVAVYTTFDAYGIRAMADPFTFLAWFFFASSIDFAILGAVRLRRMAGAPALGPLAVRGLIGGLVAYGSFGGVLLATRLDQVGEAAVLRETSILFAAAIGWLFLGDTMGPRRLALMALIAAGAVIVVRAG